MVDASDRGAGHVLVVGINHKSTSAELRERVLTDEPAAGAALLQALKGQGLVEALALVTCERWEIYAVSDEPATPEAMSRALAVAAGVEPNELWGQELRLAGMPALRHIFAVAASLESAVLGEPHVLGQIKSAHRAAADAQLLGPTLELVLQGAYGLAKRVRGETEIAEQPTSLLNAALKIARNVHGDLSRCTGLVVGLGEMGELLAQEFRLAGVENMIVVHASQARAEAAARRLECHFRPMEELPVALAEADVVVSARGSGRYLLDRPIVEAALARRRRRPIFLIDAAIPEDVEPAVGDLEGAFLYDLADLEGVARAGAATREKARAAAQRILEEELADFLRRRAERLAIPSIVALRHHFDAVREEVLANHRLDAVAATRLLVNRLLHAPTETLRAALSAAAAAKELEELTPEQLERALQRLFRIDGAKVKEDEE
jgi:glutamyl-tRNA reductase